MIDLFKQIYNNQGLLALIAVLCLVIAMMSLILAMAAQTDLLILLKGYIS